MVSGFVSLYFFYIAFFDSSLINEHERELAKQQFNNIPLEISIMRYVVFYLLYLIILPGLYFVFRQVRTQQLPNILKKQLKIFLIYLICPYIIMELLQMGYFMFQVMQEHLYATVSISTLIFTYATHYCIKQVMGLRFLNFASHVQSPPKLSLIDEFKQVFEQLSYAANLQELGHITQTFFKETFGIPLTMTSLHLQDKDSNLQADSINQTNKLGSVTEHFMHIYKADIEEYIQQSKILIYDDIAFSNFYEETENQKKVFLFLEAIQADVFIPIYTEKKIISHIIISRGARKDRYFNNVERDEMLVFAHFLGNIIHLLQNRNLHMLIQQKKELEDKLHKKQEEVNQYQESIRSFLRNTKQNAIGIIFYKNRHFILSNQAAKELIKININLQKGHTLAKACKNIGQQVQIYKSPQTCLTHDEDGNQLILSGMPHLEQNMVIITVRYPDIADIISKQANQLNDPNNKNPIIPVNPV